jgi:hypothetical protein
VIPPSPPSDGGEGWGEEVRCYWFPLSSVLPTRSSRGEDGELDPALENLRRDNFVLAKIGRADAGSSSSLKVSGMVRHPAVAAKCPGTP